jgi:hypothetical protein
MAKKAPIAELILAGSGSAGKVEALSASAGLFAWQAAPTSSKKIAVTKK